MAFAPETVIAALNALYSGQGANSEEANSYIVEWVNSEDAHITAFQILQDASQAVEIRSIVAMTLANQIMGKWDQINQLVRYEIRRGLLQIPFCCPELQAPINRCIVIIGVLEWPDEWPEFLDWLLSADPSTDAFDNSISMLGLLAEEIEQSNYIVQSRRQMLRNLFLESGARVLAILSVGIQRPQDVRDCLKILKSIFMWGSLQDIMNDEIITSLCTTFLHSPESMDLAVSCLEAIFLEKGPGRGLEVFNMYFSRVVHGFSMLGGVISEAGLAFLVKFLKEFSVNIETMAFVGCGEINKDEFMKLYEIVLTSELTDAWIGDFWILWRDIIRRLRTSAGMCDRPPFIVYMPIINQIRMMLMNALVRSIDQGRVTDPNAIGAWNLLANVDPDGFLEFISSQPPSPELTYAVGLLEGTRDERLAAVISSYISGLWSLASEDVARVAEPLLFACAHSPIILPGNEAFIENYIQLLIYCFEHSCPTYVVSASHSLYHYVKKLPEGFPLGALVPIIQKIPMYAGPMDTDPLVRLMKTVSAVAASVAQIDGNFAMGTFQVLTQTVIVLLQSDMLKGLISIREIAYSAEEHCREVFNVIWPGLIQVFAQYVNQGSYESYVVELLFDAMASGIVNCEWEHSGRAFEAMLGIITEYPSISFISLDAIAMCRARHSEVDAMFPIIWQIITQLSTLSPGLFHLLAEMDPFLFDLKEISALFFRGMHDTRNDVSYAAVNAAQSILDGLSDERRAVYLVEILEELLTVVMSTMLDCLHASIFSKEAALLHSVFLSYRFMPTEFHIQETLLRVLGAIASEPSPGFYQNFISCLTDVCADKRLFKRCLIDFIVLMKRASPSDSSIFLRKAVRTSKALTRDLSDILAPSVSLESITELDDVPIDQVRPLQIRRRSRHNCLEPN